MLVMPPPRPQPLSSERPSSERPSSERPSSQPQCLHPLRAAREALGLSQAALAAATRLSRQSIGAIESGRAVPAVDVALRIAAALQQSVEALFGVPAAAPVLTTEPVAAAQSGSRVALAQIGG